jgi:hypothetical protein
MIYAHIFPLGILYQCPTAVTQRAGAPVALVSFLQRGYFLLKVFPMLIINFAQVCWIQIEKMSPKIEFLTTYKVVSESSWTVIVVTAPVKEDDRGGQGHTLEVYCVSHVTSQCEHASFLHEYFLNFVFHIV